MDSTIIIALITGGLSLAGTMAGSYFSQRKSTALISYRLEELEKKVDQHNKVIERTYKLEERVALTEKDIRVSNHRLEDLERTKVG